MKKLLSIVLALTLILGMCVTVSAAEGSKYDDFTTIANGNFPGNTNGWIQNGEGTVEFVTEDVAEGSHSLRMKSGTPFYFYQKIYLVGNTEYTLSFQVKGESGTKGAIKFEFQNTYEGVRLGEQYCSFVIDSKEWTKQEFKVKVPEGANFAVCLLRLMSAGDMYIDDIYLDGPIAPENAASTKAFEEKKQALTEKEPLEGADNMIVNGSYEDLDSSGYPSSIVTFDKWGTYASVEKNGAYDGENCVKIIAPEPKYPWVRHVITNPVGGARYQVTFYYKSDNDNFGVKFEYYGQRNSSAPFYEQLEAGKFPKSDEWKKVTYSVRVPERAEEIWLYMRNYDKNGGTAYVDNVSMYMVEKPEEFNSGMWTDGVFYYDHIKEGKATITLNSSYDGAEYTADFVLLDNKTPLAKASDVPFVDNVATFNYSLEKMYKDLPYTVQGTVTKANGEKLTFTQNIYIVDRPTLIDDKGICYDLNGKVIDPLVCYHVGQADQADAAKGGINVVQGTFFTKPEDAVAYFDKAQENGVKVAIPLYRNMKPAGHPENLVWMKTIVNAIKDHPALFGYLIQDEPFAHADKLEMASWLETSYLEIHKIDKNHPIMSVECFHTFLTETIKYVDFLIIDPYPGAHSPYLTHVGDFGGAASKIAEKHGKPVLNLLQTFTFNYSGPKVGEVRHMAYQSYLSGQQYVGWYPWQKEGQVDTVDVDESIWYPEMVQFAQKERPILAKHFSQKTEPTFNKYSDEVVSYETWVSGKDVYLALINHTYDAHDVSVSLKSTNGRVALDNVQAQILFGEKVAVTPGAETLDIALKGADCLLIKMTPATAVNTAALSESAFDDLAGYDWAADAINEIFVKGIANARGEATYAPGEAITRGEFAMFLVRTLGITAAVSGNFDDVAADAVYAKELAIGKAAGILNGVGDNKFNPEATITRQDMMTIISRGMKLYGEADMSAFSDSASIADYALSHVSAMIYTGLVKGNADGTINPLGNTTRAEAAVIMQRILGL